MNQTNSLDVKQNDFENKELTYIDEKINSNVLNENSLELLNERFTVFECRTEVIEMYQVKMFYYQTVPGLIPFRFSMSQKKSYFYFKKDGYINLTDLQVTNLEVKDIIRILEQIKLVYDMCNNYLLYEENILIKPSRIKVQKNKNEMTVNCMYLPFKKACFSEDKSDFAQFANVLSKMFNAVDYMDGYYYFTRLYQDICEGTENIGIHKHLILFLENSKLNLNRKL